MLFKGTIIAAASGSMGGLTFSRGKGGPYIRIRANPIHPGSVFQETVKAAFSQLSIAWQDELTPAERAAWDAYAAQVSLVNRVGDPIYVTGANHFIRSNVPRIQIGATRIDAAPIVYTLGNFTEPGFLVDSATAKIACGFINTDDWAGEENSWLSVYASVPKSPTINYHKGPYRYVGSIEGDSVTPPTSPLELDCLAPTAVGQRTFVRCFVTRADGRLSYAIFDQADAT